MRLFVAVDLCSEQKKMLTSLQNELKTRFKNVKWVESVALHITLKFLGEVEKNTDELIALLEESVSSFTSFELSLKGLGFFSNHRRPRIIWVGVEQGKNYLEDLSSRINTTLSEFNNSENKPYSPHVTLGRIRIPEQTLSIDKFINNYSLFKTPVSQVSCINLYRSVLSPQGASYISLEKIYF